MILLIRASYCKSETYNRKFIGSAFSKPIPGVSVGISATGAIDAFTRGLAVDLAPIRVNSVFPGLVDTEVNISPWLFREFS